MAWPHTSTHDVAQGTEQRVPRGAGTPRTMRILFSLTSWRFSSISVLRCSFCSCMISFRMPDSRSRSCVLLLCSRSSAGVCTRLLGTTAVMFRCRFSFSDSRCFVCRRALLTSAGSMEDWLREDVSDRRRCAALSEARRPRLDLAPPSVAPPDPAEEEALDSPRAESLLKRR